MSSDNAGDCAGESAWEGIRPAVVARTEMVVPINAPKARVWKAVTQEMQKWWLPDFHMAHPQSKMVVEMTAGGRVYEEGPDGSNLLWFKVAAVRPGESVHWEGSIMVPWGGPVVAQAWLRLEEAAGRTTLRFTQCFIGIVDDSMISSMREGWTMLLEQGLKRHVETGG